jgi:hypothetical protein
MGYKVIMLMILNNFLKILLIEYLKISKTPNASNLWMINVKVFNQHKWDLSPPPTTSNIKPLINLIEISNPNSNLNNFSKY